MSMKDYAVAATATNACLTESSQADFQTETRTSVDLVASPGNVILLNPSTIDQQSSIITANGTAFNSTAWVGQSFTPAVTGKLARADIDLFCSTCTGTTPDITVSIRATTGSPAVPTRADLATATITGFSSGS